MADALDQFIQDSKAASQNRFGSIVGTMSQHGYMFNPATGTFIRDPNYIDPATALQLNPDYIASRAAAEAAATTAAQNAAKMGTVASGNDLTGYVDSNGNTPPNGISYGQLTQSGKYKPITGDEKQFLDGVAGAQNLLNQIKDASNSINTGHGAGNNNVNPFQWLKGFAEQHIGNTQADFLANGAKGLLTTITSTLLANKRYNESEMNQLTNLVPKPTDTAEVAKSKIDRFQKILDASQQKILGASGGSTPSGSASSGGGKPSLDSIFGGK